MIYNSTINIAERFRTIAPELAVKVKELLSLESGWDGEDAKPVSTQFLNRAGDLLALLKRSQDALIVPFIAPTFEGSVLLDWVGPRRTLEVEAESTGWSIAMSQAMPHGRVEYSNAQCDSDSGIVDYYRWFQCGII